MLNEPTEADRRELARLEEAMWREETRFDTKFMERHLAADFFKFGRWGRTYTRAQSLAVSRQPRTCPKPRTGVDVLMARHRSTRVARTRKFAS